MDILTRISIFDDIKKFEVDKKYFDVIIMSMKNDTENSNLIFEKLDLIDQ